MGVKQELTNGKLSKALASGQRNFTQTVWDSMAVDPGLDEYNSNNNIRMDHFIKADGVWYVPLEAWEIKHQGRIEIEISVVRPSEAAAAVTPCPLASGSIKIHMNVLDEDGGMNWVCI